MSNRILAAFLLVLLIMSLPIPSALAQGRRNRADSITPPDSTDPFNGPNGNGFGIAQISGTVRTYDGRSVNDANVVARNVERPSVFTTARTDSSGRYVLRNLQPGNYEVTVSTGLEQASQRVDVGRGDSDLDFRLSNRTATSNGPGGSTVSLSQISVPPKARSLLEKATQLMVRGKLDQSLEKVNAALTIYPKFAEALTLRGIINERTGKASEALNDYRQAIQHDANYALAYLAQASLLNSMGQFKESGPILERFDQLAPNHWQTAFEMARSCLGRGDLQAAMSNVTRASQLHGGAQKDLPEMHLLRGYILIGLSDLSKAAEEMQAFLAREPNGPAADAARQVLAKMTSSTVAASR